MSDTIIREIVCHLPLEAVDPNSTTHYVITTLSNRDESASYEIACASALREDVPAGLELYWTNKNISNIQKRLNSSDSGNLEIDTDDELTSADSRKTSVDSSFKGSICDICNKCFVQKDGLLNHKQKTHKIFTCRIDGCGQEFSNSKSQIEHLNTKHNPLENLTSTLASDIVSRANLPIVPIPAIQETTHKCLVCQKVLPNEEQLTKHLLSHAKTSISPNTQTENLPTLGQNKLGSTGCGFKNVDASS